jgi:anaerobic selenocysteine-containing dehydrogenase
MCACRCGIDVHIRDGKVRYIEGNRDHPVNKGVLCAKGSAGSCSTTRPGGSASRCCGRASAGAASSVRSNGRRLFGSRCPGSSRSARRPKKLAFFTGRDQSQQLTSWCAQQFGTPNFAAHGGFCSVQHGRRGIMTIGGAFWEFGSPDWDRTKMFMLFGVAEDHDSNPIKLGLSKLKARGAKVVGVNPVRTGYNAIADEWVGITPGTDGLFVLALVHELLKAGQVDVDYLIRYTNAAWLVIDDPGAPDHGLFARDGDGGALIWDRAAGKLIPHHRAGVKPALKGEFRLDDGRPAVPAFQLLAQKYLDERYAPENVAGETGVPAATMRRLAAELTHTAFREEIVVEQPWTDMKGERHERMIGRPVTFHAMRGISAHSNGFQTCRALHLLQVLLGRSTAPAVSAWSRPIRSRSTRIPARPAMPSRANRCAAHPLDSHGGRRTCCWKPTGSRRSASTRRIRGKRRSPHTA